MSTSAIAHIRRVAPGGVGDDEIRAMLEATGRDPARVRAALEAWWRREDGEGSGSDSGASARPPRCPSTDHTNPTALSPTTQPLRRSDAEVTRIDP